MKNKLFEIITQCIDIGAFVDEIAEDIGNPMWIMDNSYNVLAMSRNPDASGFLAKLEDSDTMIGHIKMWQENGLLDQLSRRQGPVRIYDDLFERNLIVMDVFSEKKEIGRMTIVLENGMSDEDAEAIAKGASVYLRSSETIENYSVCQQAFASLLNGIDTEQSVGYLRSSGYTAGNTYQIVALRCRNLSVLRVAENDMKMHDYHLLSVIMGNTLYLLKQRRSETTDFSCYPETESGSSLLFEELAAACDYRKQADFSLDQGMPFSQCIKDYLKFCVQEQIHPFSLVDIRIRNMIRYDAEYDTDYLETLKSYFRCHESKKQTSEELGIHLNTVKYRLNQMEELFEILPERDADMIRLSLAMLDESK